MCDKLVYAPHMLCQLGLLLVAGLWAGEAGMGVGLRVGLTPVLPQLPRTAEHCPAQFTVHP